MPDSLLMLSNGLRDVDKSQIRINKCSRKLARLNVMATETLFFLYVIDFKEHMTCFVPFNCIAY